MKPFVHCRISVKEFGGQTSDYQKLHDWFDQTKSNLPDMRHRAILHSSFGIYLLEQMFGTTMTNSDGRILSVRDIGEQHVLDDLGFIPTVERWLAGMTLEPWMSGTRRKRSQKFIPAKTADERVLDLSNVPVMDVPRFIQIDPSETPWSFGPMIDQKFVVLD